MPAATPLALLKTRRGALLAASGTVLLVVLLVWGVHWYRFQASHVVSDDAQVEGDVVTVSSKIPGRVAAILVSDNAAVAAGAPLFRLETEDLEVARAKARAGLAAAEGQLAEAT